MDDGSAADVDAWARKHAKHIYKMLCGYTGDPELAEDLTQETMLQAWKNRDSFKPGAPVWPWLSSIALHLCSNAQAANRLHAAREAMAIENQMLTEMDLDPADVVAEREGTLLSALPVHYRRYLLLKYPMRYSIQEIAALEGSTVDAVTSTLHRARRALKKQYTRSHTPLLVPPFAARAFLSRVGRKAHQTTALLAPTGESGWMLAAAVGIAVSSLGAGHSEVVRFHRSTPVAIALNVEHAPSSSRTVVAASHRRVAPAPRRVSSTRGVTREVDSSTRASAGGVEYEREGKATVHCEGVTASILCDVLTIAFPQQAP
jgi:RNA polymerase sigma factor (sigma-70 family)